MTSITVLQWKNYRKSGVGLLIVIRTLKSNLEKLRAVSDRIVNGQIKQSNRYKPFIAQVYALTSVST